MRYGLSVVAVVAGVAGVAVVAVAGIKCAGSKDTRRDGELRV